MNERNSFSDLIYEQQTQLAERELSSFIAAVRELYGPVRRDLPRRTGWTNQTSWIARLDLTSGIGARSRSQRQPG